MLFFAESDGERIYEAYHGTNDTSGIRDFHSRFQPFIMFFIDAASYIDIDDSNWNLYFLLVHILVTRFFRC